MSALIDRLAHQEPSFGDTMDNYADAPVAVIPLRRNDIAWSGFKGPHTLGVVPLYAMKRTKERKRIWTSMLAWPNSLP